ncbi:MAG TPA: glycoside hydrolase family 76 protein [Trebonia sp.]|jgi:predicted alpha-1,6-mannanase (GH76 family)|nr:glycoside hydrolase family 76 protein [Trebonia sp.]
MGADLLARAAAAAGALQRWYVPRTGLWKTTGWWNAANALTALIGYTRHTGDGGHAAVVATTFRRARRAHPDFVNMFFDDNGWWALAWVAAYDLTGERGYLDAARTIFARNLAGWDGVCGGGLWWTARRTYKNAITNELFITLAAQLHERTPGDQEYLSWALRGWEWLTGRALIGPGGLVNDGLTAGCANNGGTAWTYNQGVILGGLATLYDITGDRDYLRHGEFIADAALGRLTDGNGILTEPCELAADGCDGDATQFKGIFARNLHEFYQRSGKRGYRDFLLANADSVWESARNADDQFGLRWAGPFDYADASRQSSALEVLTAAVALTRAA